MTHEMPHPETRRPSRRSLGLTLALGLMTAAGAATGAPPTNGEAFIGNGNTILEQVAQDQARIRSAALRNILIVGATSLAAILVIAVYAGRQRRALAAAQASLQAGEAALQAMADVAQDAIALTDERGEIRYWNAAAEVLFGMTPAQAIGRPLPSLFADEAGTTPEFDVLLGTMVAGTPPPPGQWEAVHLNGHQMPVRAAFAPLDPGQGRRAIAILRQGCTPIECAYEPLVANVIMENARESIVITDAAGTILRVNPAYCDLTGYSAEEVVGKNSRILNAGRHERPFFEALWGAVLQEGRWEGKIWNRRKDGTLFLEHLTIVALPKPDGTPGHYVGIFSDITHQGLDPAQIGELAFYDPLTGLATRALLIDHLCEAVRHSERTGRHAVLFYINLDDFSDINQRLGHAGGDALLKDFAERLDSTVRQDDTVARPGGDEFAVIMREMAALQDVPRVADKLLEGLSAPYEYEGQAVRLTASIGISLYPSHSDELEQLVGLARQAMTQAKAEGKHRWVMHQPKDDAVPTGHADH